MQLLTVWAPPHPRSDALRRRRTDPAITDAAVRSRLPQGVDPRLRGHVVRAWATQLFPSNLEVTMVQQDPTRAGQVGDVELALYGGQRQHELELNRVSAGLELALVSPTLLLNGAAAVAFLTLLGAASASDSRLQLDVSRVRLAIAIWCLGLLVAAFAVGAAHRSQRQFTMAVRARRVLYEGALLNGRSALAHVRPKPNESEDPDTLRASGSKWQKAWQVLSILDLLVFGIGVLVAARSIGVLG